MKISPILLIISLSTTVVLACSTAKKTEKPQQENTVSDSNRNLIIYYDAAVGKEGLIKTVDSYGAKLLHDYNSLHGIAIQIPQGKSMDKAINHFKKINGVISVDRDQAMQLN